MFYVDGDRIVISRGDTGGVRFLTATEYEFKSAYDGDETHGDRALFTIKDQAGAVVKRKICKIVDNAFEVYFYHNDTQGLLPATYRWDVRYFLYPYYDEDGYIVDADQVITPKQPLEMQTLDVVGDR